MDKRCDVCDSETTSVRFGSLASVSSDARYINHAISNNSLINQKFTKKCESLISGFVKKVNTAMSNSDNAIKQAEFAISQLQSLTEDVDDVLNELNNQKCSQKTYLKMVLKTCNFVMGCLNKINSTEENKIYLAIEILKKTLNLLLSLKLDF